MKRLFAAALLLGLVSAAPPPPPTEIDILARDVQRAESLRAVKNLQRLYAQYAQYGLWAQVGALFSANGGFTFDGQIQKAQSATGPAEIAAFLRNRYGGGHEGLQPGDVRTFLLEPPIVNLSRDGNSALGRWHLLVFHGTTGRAEIEGGIFENEYVRERGVWKIAAAHYYPQFHGPYADGWTNWGGGDLPIVPYHFTTDSAGTPIPAPTGSAPRSGATLASLHRRIAALNDEDAVRNLQSAYGYYADRKMWDDVTDLFADGGAIEVGGAGVYRGAAGIRRWLETMGPPGLTHGQLNDRVQFDTTVTLSPNGREAWARGIELGMLGEADQQKGWWDATIFRNRYVKEGGIWKIREMRRFPMWKTDYFQGWGKSRIVDPVPTGAHAADGPSTSGATMPAFLSAHPVSGRPVAAPSGVKAVAATPLTGVIRGAVEAPGDLGELRRRLAISTAYDGVENVSTAYGDYLDDFQSPSFSALIAEKGFKMSAFAGYYVGRDRVNQAGLRVWGKPPVTRPGVSYHWRIQPVILIASDGRSANARIRLFQPRTGKTVGKAGDFYGASFWNGMYHDQFVLENGSWRFFNLSLDEPYINPVGWKGGWAMAKDPPPAPPGQAASPLVAANSNLQPDVPVKALGKREEHFRGGTGDPWQWPTILPMWFEYTNPVTGRVPELYQDDCVPCKAAPQLRLDRNGFLQPPTDPKPVGAK